MSAVDLDIRAVARMFTSHGAQHRAVDGVSFAVEAGQFFSILGPSGCGKTTLMRMIAGFDHPDSGDILIRGQSMLGVPPNRRPVNMVFQNLALFPMMSVGENVAYGLACRGIKGAAAAERVTRILDRLGLAGFAGRAIGQLSGGQKQRVAIARCLVLEPTLVLLDEPLGALDLKLREQMKVELKQIQASFGTTFVYITHDQSEALVMSDHVAVMNHGRFEQIGTPQDLYHRPKTGFVAGFVGASNRLAVTVTGDDGVGRLRLALPGGAEWLGQGAVSAGPAEAFIRPEAIALAPAGETIPGADNIAKGTVRDVLFDGAASTVLVSLATDCNVLVLLPQAGPMAAVKPGDSVSLGWSVDATKVFAPSEAA